MRLVTYNILDGGLGRADPLAEVLLNQRADVIVLCEAERPGYLTRIAGRLGDGWDTLHFPGNGRSLAVLTRLPVVSAVNHALLQDAGPRAWAEAVVLTGGREVSVTGLHLSPHRPRHAEDKRLRELAPVLETLAGRRAAGEGHVVAGDLNSVHPDAQIDESRLRPEDLHGLRENDNALPRDVLRALLDAGYVDAPTGGGTLDTIGRGLRVDYVLTHGLDVASAWTETDRLARYASDHYPVGVELA